MRRGRLALPSACLVLMVVGSVAPSSLAEGEDAAPLRFRPRGMSGERFAPVTEPTPETVHAHDYYDNRVELFTRVFRPDTSSDPTWRTPVILVVSASNNLTPAGEVYDQTNGQDYTAGRAFQLARYFTPRGYTVVLADSRGTGNSGGCQDLWGSDSAKDFETLVKHFAAKDWSNHRVGSFGLSYDGFMQNAGVVRAPPHLVTIVPIHGGSGSYDSNYFDGVPFSIVGAQPLAYTGLSLLPPQDVEVWPRMAQRADPKCAGDMLSTFDVSGDMKPYWEEREFRLRVSEARASVLYVNGFPDRNKMVNMAGFYDGLPGFKRAILGQWVHCLPDGGSEGSDCAVLDAEWLRNDWQAIVHAWFDYWLLGLDTGVPDWPAVQVQDHNRVWRAVPSMAALGVPRAFPLGAGTIGAPGPAGSSSTFSETDSTAWEMAVAQDVHLSGQAALEGEITLDRDDAHFAIKLEEKRPDGTVRWIQSGYLSARHRTSLFHGTPVPPGQPVSYRIRTRAFDVHIRAGSRLRLVLAGMDEEWILPAGNGYSASIATDGSSRLVLPFVEEYCGIDVDQAFPPLVQIPGCVPR